MPNTSYSSPSPQRLPDLGIRLLHAWYWLAAPPPAPAHASLLAREIARRGRVTSLVMLVTVAMVLLAFIIQPTVQVSITLLVATVIDSIALAFNRRGKITLAGLIITLTTEIGLLLSLFGYLQEHGGVDVDVVTFFPLLVQSIVIAVSALPPLSVLPILVLNCSVVLGVTIFWPYSSSFLAYLHQHEPQTFFGLLIVPLTVFLMVAFVSLIWVLSANDAIKRVDKADARAEYEQQMALYEREISGRLTRDLQVITQIIAQLATNPTQGISIERENSFWVLETSLNNLRRRLLHVRFDRSQFQQTQAAAASLISWLEAASRAGYLPAWTPSKTVIDEIVYRIQKLPLQTQPEVSGNERDPINSTVPGGEQDRQRLRQGAFQLFAALNSVEPMPWHPTGTMLDDVAAQLLPWSSMPNGIKAHNADPIR
jgi:hypothetical protein